MRKTMLSVMLLALCLSVPSFGDESQNSTPAENDATTLNDPAETGSCMQMCAADGYDEDECEADCVQIAWQGQRVLIACK